MKAAPAFQFYPHDFLVGTAEFTAEETGAYIRLLCYQWAKGKLPSSIDKLQQLAGCTSNACASIMHKFRIDDAGAYYNARLEEVRLDQEKYRLGRSNNAKSRWKPKHVDSTSNAHAQHVGCSSPSPSPSITTTIRAEVEPPSGFPRSESEAIAMCASAGVLKENAVRLYHDAVGCGYLDYRGRLIKNFASHCKSSVANLTDYEARMNRLNASRANGFQLNNKATSKSDYEYEKP